MHIRPACDADAEVLAELVNALAAEQQDPTEHFTAESARRDALGGTPAFSTLVAETGGEVVGYVTFLEAYESSFAARGLYLSDLYVRPDARGKGIGRALVAAVAREAKQQERSFVWWVSKPGNKAAQEFYRKLGASQEPVLAHALTFGDFEQLVEEAKNLRRER